MGTNGRVYDNILQCIGNTPMVRLNRIPKDHGLECEIFAKCEFLNPGGSIKDRISYTMVQDAEKSGKAKSGTRFVEPTSGNTGIGVSLTAAVLGYDCTIVTPDKNSDEKMSTMSLLGSEIIQTPSLAHYEDPDSFVSVARRILEEDPNAISMDQYCNEVNPATHYEHTAEEILAAVSEPDVLVMGAGTGGTVTGIARKFRERCPRCAIVVVDPMGSLLFGDGKYSLFFVEGIGGDFVPRVLDKALIDKVVKPTDHEAFNMSREIIRKEGLLCGGSSGAIVHSAIRAAKELKLGAGKRVVVLLPDGIRNYMTKFVCDQWMEAHLFKEPPRRDAIWWKRCISDLKIKRNVPAIRQNCSCKDALAAMSSENTVIFIVNDDGYFQGVVSKDSLRSEATNPKKGILNFNDNIMKYVMKKYYKIIENKGAPTVGLAARVLDIAPFVIVVEEYRDTNRNYSGYIPKGIINSDIVLDYIIEQQNHV